MTENRNRWKVVLARPASLPRRPFGLLDLVRTVLLVVNHTIFCKLSVLFLRSVEVQLVLFISVYVELLLSFSKRFALF